MEGSSMAAVAYRITVAAMFSAICADVVQALPLDGTQWHVKAINSHVTPLKADYHIAFKDSRMSARFGCNAISGSFRLSNGRVTVSQLVSTKMACGAPAGAFEEAAVGILHSPMKVEKSTKDRLRLSNRVGSMDLEPGP